MKLKELIKSIRLIYIPLSFFRSLIKRFVVSIKFIFKKRHVEGENKELIIMGTGPSLKTDINSIVDTRASRNIMAVNSYCLEKYFDILKPEYYVLADPVYYSKNVEGIGKENRNLFVKTVKEKVNWKMIIIIPEAGKHSWLVNEFNNSNYISFQYLPDNCDYFPFCMKKFKAYNKYIARPWIQNVLQMCLFFAISNNFKKVYLYGADHNWCKDITVNKDNVVCIEEKHCYDDERHKFHAIEKVDGSYWTMGELFEAWTKVYNGYYELEQYAKYNNVKIYNCSSTSFIDAFERS